MPGIYNLGLSNKLLKSLQTATLNELQTYGYSNHIVHIDANRYEEETFERKNQSIKRAVNVGIYLERLSYNAKYGGAGLVEIGEAETQHTEVRLALQKALLTNSQPTSLNVTPNPFRLVLPTEPRSRYQLHATVNFIVNVKGRSYSEGNALLHEILEMLFLMILRGNTALFESLGIHLTSEPVIEMDPQADKLLTEIGEAKPGYTGMLQTAYRLLFEPTKSEVPTIKSVTLLKDIRVQIRAG